MAFDQLIELVHELRGALAAGQDTTASLEAELEVLVYRQAATERELRQALEMALHRTCGLESEIRALSSGNKFLERELRRVLQAVRERKDSLEAEITRLADLEAATEGELLDAMVLAHRRFVEFGADIAKLLPDDGETFGPDRTAAGLREALEPASKGVSNPMNGSHSEETALPSRKQPKARQRPVPETERNDNQIAATSNTGPGPLDLASTGPLPNPFSRQSEEVPTVGAPQMMRRRKGDIHLDSAAHAVFQRNPQVLMPLVIGKFSSREILDDALQCIVPRGALITRELAERAKGAGKLQDLWADAVPEPPEPVVAT